MADKRKDNKGRNLRQGECQRKDGRYMYRWTVGGKEKSVYAMSLMELREKKKQIAKDIDDGVDTQSNIKVTLNDTFDKYMETKTIYKRQ